VRSVDRVHQYERLGRRTITRRIKGRMLAPKPPNSPNPYVSLFRDTVETNYPIRLLVQRAFPEAAADPRVAA
jgi:hypothetical protein